jgi:hypothetical protein
VVPFILHIKKLQYNRNMLVEQHHPIKKPQYNHNIKKLRLYRQLYILRRKPLVVSFVVSLLPLIMFRYSRKNMLIARQFQVSHHMHLLYRKPLNLLQ